MKPQTILWKSSTKLRSKLWSGVLRLAPSICFFFFYEANSANLCCPSKFRRARKKLGVGLVPMVSLTKAAWKLLSLDVMNHTLAFLLAMRQWKVISCYSSELSGAPVLLHLSVLSQNSEGITAYRKDLNPRLSLQLNLSVLLVTPQGSKTNPRAENKYLISLKQVSTSAET